MNKINKLQKGMTLALTFSTFCLNQLNADSDTKTKQPTVPKEISISTNLKTFIKEVQEQKLKMKIRFNKKLTILYNQGKGDTRMKGIYFQAGQLLISDDPLDSTKPWCFFQSRLKLDEDTIIPKNYQVAIIEMEAYSNNQTQEVLSYSFVDFESGKTMGETSRFIPFNFQCSFLKTESFTYEKFLEVTGKRLSLEVE